MPKDQELNNPQQVKFVREGETLSKGNFAAIMNRFVAESFQKPRTKDPDETNMQYMRNVKEVQTANILKAKVFFDKMIGMLTPEQRQQIYADAPEKVKENLTINTLRGLSAQVSHIDAYKDLDGKLERHEYADEQEKQRLTSEKQALQDSFNSLTARGRTLEDARKIVGPYMTEEQLNSALDPTAHIAKENFIRSNYEYISDKVKDMLTPEQMAELNATVNDYVAPWERKPEEMGETAYDQESEKAKADIDAMGNFSPEQKEAMKADIDAANDFLRKPSNIEDPIEFYQDLSASNSGYDSALMKDEEARGKDQATKEGLDLGAVEERPNMETFNIDVVVVEGKEEAYQKLENEDYKFAPETKEAIKHLYTKMQEYGYLGNGIVLEQGTKKYGLSKLSDAIDAYKDAIESGDATKIAEASKAMMTEQAHADELIGYVREHFPVDPKSDNFARSGNVDVVRNDNFPPKYRMDEAVACLNSMYIMANFADANGVTIDELLDHPMKVAKDYFLDKKNQGLNNALKGKTGGEALFEASRDKKMVTALGFGGARPFEALIYADKDPAIRAHNNAIWKYMDTAVVNNGDMLDVQRRDVAYKQGHLDRFLYVTEPRDNASLLGVPIYNVKTLKYDQPEAFDEAKYLQTNGKSVGEMKETLDKNLKEFLHLSKTQLYRTINGQLQEQPAFGGNRLLELAQEAASKILMAKHAEKDDPAYEQLKGILTNGQEYVNNLIQAEKDKVLDAEQKLAEAQKAGDQKEIDRLQKYIDENKAYKEIEVEVTQPQTKYAENLAAFEKKVAECDVKRPEGANLKPDEDFNKSIVDMRAKLAELNTKISDRTLEVGAMNSIKDDQIQLLTIHASQIRADIDKAKEDYKKQLEEDVKAGRIFASYKEARIKQLDDKEYKYDKLPDFFPTGDKKEVGAFLARRDGKEFGFVTTKPEVKPEENVAEKQEEKTKVVEPVDFSGKWFKPGQQVTNDDLLAKVNEINARLASPIEKENWLETRKEHEVRQREEMRLDVVYKEAWKTLSDKDKQKVYDALNEQDRASAMKAGEIGDSLIKKNPAIWEPLIKNIPADKLRSIALHADAKQTGMERMTLEEARISRYGEEVGSVKNVVDQMAYLHGEPMTKERKAEIYAKLDRAQDMMADLEKGYADELGDLRKAREESDYGMNGVVRDIAQKGLTEQGFNVTPHGNMEMKWAGEQKEKFVTEDGKDEWATVKPEDQADYQRLKSQKFEYSADTKQKILDIFKKFDEYGYDQSIFMPEEGGKIYALHKYGKARGEFTEKIKSDDPLEKIQAIEAADKMKLEYDRVKELIQQAREVYGVDKGGFWPGNMDVERNHAAPPEFRDDLNGMSALNGLYLVYREVKAQNYDYDKFVEDPAAFVNSEVERYIQKHDVNATIKGKSGAEAMFEAFIPANDANIDHYAISRLVENLGEMESDPALREKNFASAYAHRLANENTVAEMGGVRSFMSNIASKHLDRFLMVKEPQQDGSLLGVHTMDFHTKTIIPPKEFDEMEYLMNNPEDPKEFAERVMKEGGKFMAMIDKENLMKEKKQGVTDGEIGFHHGVEAMQKAAIKFLAAHPDLDKHSEAYQTLNSLATDGPKFVKNMLTEQVSKGQINLNMDHIDFDEIENHAPKQSLADFKKSNDMKHFGDEYITEDKDLNRELKTLQKALDRARGEVSKAEAQQKLDEAIANRKKELLEAFRKGKITEDYLNKRNEQLDGHKFDEKPPKMFEADQLMSQKDYLNKKYPDDLDELSKEEKAEIYQRYVDNAKRAKEQFITNKYLESEGLSTHIGHRTMAERIAEEDARLVRMGEAPIKGGAEKAKDEPEVKKEEKVEEKKVENVDVNLEEEEEIEFKPEEKAQEKAQEKEKELDLDDGVEQISIDLDDEDAEMLNDILNFGGQEKNLEKGKGPLDK